MIGFSLILLGSNLGDKENTIDKAVEMIGERCGTIVEKSSLYETAPWGFVADNNFLNQVISIETVLDPHQLLMELMRIETVLGRIRHDVEGYESRPIDLDILYYENKIINEDDLIIPHPRLHLRRFVLEPLSEIVPNFVHPVFKKTSLELLYECTDSSEVILYKRNSV